MCIYFLTFFPKSSLLCIYLCIYQYLRILYFYNIKGPQMSPQQSSKLLWALGTMGEKEHSLDLFIISLFIDHIFFNRFVYLITFVFIF